MQFSCLRIMNNLPWNTAVAAVSPFPSMEWMIRRCRCMAIVAPTAVFKVVIGITLMATFVAHTDRTVTVVVDMVLVAMDQADTTGASAFPVVPAQFAADPPIPVECGVAVFTSDRVPMHIFGRFMNPQTAEQSMNRRHNAAAVIPAVIPGGAENV